MFDIFLDAFKLWSIFWQRSDIDSESEVFWTKEEAETFCINYMNQSAGYKACLGVPNINPENAIADCVADIQVFIHFD